MRKLALLSMLFGTLAAVYGACTTESSGTADCPDDMAKGYPDPTVDGGCNRFAQCVDEQNNAIPVQKCCVQHGIDGGVLYDDAGDAALPLVGTDMDLCLYGYGVGPPPPTGASTGGGMGGAGGSGGAGGGTGGAGGN